MIEPPRDETWCALLEATPDALVVVDVEGHIVWANAETEALFGYAHGDLLGQLVEVLVPQRFRGRHAAFRQGYQQAPSRRPMGAAVDLHGLRKDGGQFPIEIRLGPAQTPQGLFVVAAIRDIGQRQKVEDLRHNNLQQASRLKSEILASMSHELRTPLNSIIGFARLMQLGKVGPVSERHREYLADILDSGNDLLRIVNDVFELSRADAGGSAPQAAAFEAEQILNEVREVGREMAGTKPIHFTVHVDPACTRLHVDPARLRQVLYNYLSSAIRSSPVGGVIDLRVRPQGPEQIRVEVEAGAIATRAGDLSEVPGFDLPLATRIVEAQGGHAGVAASATSNTFFAVLPRRPLRDDHSPHG
jgi:PAS domain S-box-containing protein